MLESEIAGDSVSSTSVFTDAEVATMLGVSEATVRRSRPQQQGPKFLKLGAAVRCRHQNITTWLESRPSGGEHQTEAQ